MTVFRKDYASSYDSLYHDKPYEKECSFMESLFKKYTKKVKTILDLGCGTGGHAVILARRGYEVTGVDRSDEMLASAGKKAKKAGRKIDFHRSSIQSLNLNKKFDAVIAMFAVISYQTENEDLAVALETVEKHLKPGGIFIFDAWNGLAVIADHPGQRIKEVESGKDRIIRIANAKIDVLSHIAYINFKVLTLKQGTLVSETEEMHNLRFLFPQEIRYFLQTAGFSKVNFCPFLESEKKLRGSDWNMTVIARR